MNKLVHDPSNPDCGLFPIHHPAASTMFGCRCRGGTLEESANELSTMVPRAGLTIKEMEEKRSVNGG